jgi:hypothetical protein
MALTLSREEHHFRVASNAAKSTSWPAQKAYTVLCSRAGCELPEERIGGGAKIRQDRCFLYPCRTTCNPSLKGKALQNRAVSRTGIFFLVFCSPHKLHCLQNGRSIYLFVPPTIRKHSVSERDILFAHPKEASETHSHRPRCQRKAKISKALPAPLVPVGFFHISDTQS